MGGETQREFCLVQLGQAGKLHRPGRSFAADCSAQQLGKSASIGSANKAHGRCTPIYLKT